MKRSFRIFFLMTAVLLLFFSFQVRSADCEGGEPILTDEEVDVSPERIEGEHPAYPENARADKISGIVIAELIISSEGNVDDVKIIRGIEGDYEKDFNEEVFRVVRTYKFKPAVHEGENVPVKIQVTFDFKLDDSKPLSEKE